MFYDNDKSLTGKMMLSKGNGIAVAIPMPIHDVIMALNSKQFKKEIHQIPINSILWLLSANSF